MPIGIKHKIIPLFPSASSLLGKYGSCPNEKNLRRSSAYALSLVMLSLLLLSLLLNYYEGTHSLLPALAFAALSPLITFFWLRTNQNSTIGPLLLLTFTLMLLGAYLLLVQGAPNNGSLGWFIIFPVVVMGCLGLRLGSFIFIIYFAFLLTLMLSPLQHLMPEKLALAVRLRFLLIIFGSFIFSWCAEYMRHQTYQALLEAATRLQRDSLTDPLTGLGNRRDFENFFNWVKAQAQREQYTFCLAMIDIDHFKKINDAYGHAMGDKVLNHTVETVSFHLRSTDRIFRWGGEEFILLMPDTNLENARLVAERVRSKLETTPFCSNDLTINYTISIGLHLCTHFQTITEQVAKADENLYVAKSSGRNLVIG